jgi:radical SAM protein with 4Fe4S-binding SPASM domain|tara:strand:+ start:271 stop:1164 length:894 start_codon:yes stop_codon:yes gene_type:complete
MKYVDKNIKRKSKIVSNTLQFIKDSKIPLPSVIEISDSGTCNRSCVFCPRSDPAWIKKFDNKEFIKKELHEKICKELSRYNYSGIIVYSGFNEPLLNKACFENIKRTREYLPDAKIELITNGDVLNLTRIKKLFASGLSTLLISVYDGPDDMQKFQNLCKEANLNEDQYVVRNRYLPPDKDYGITMSNRAGLMKNAVHSVKPLSKSSTDPCYYPSYTFFIDYNGDVLMCSHDWGKKNILGNLNKHSFIEVWTSQLSKITRKSLLKGDRNFSPCNVCDVKGNLIGKTHGEAWERHYKN